MRSAPALSLLAVLSLAAPSIASAQGGPPTYVHRDTASPWIDLVALPGVQDITELTINVGGNDDGGATNVSIPFSFHFMGDTFDVANVSTNGFVSFDPAGLQRFNNEPIGQSAEPNLFIAPWWDDLVVPGAFGDTGVLGTAPNRIFVIEVRGLHKFGGGGTIHWQVWLYEGPAGRFDLRVHGSASTNHSATIGYEGRAGNGGATLLACSPGCDVADFNSRIDRVYSVFASEDPELHGVFGQFVSGALPGQAVRANVEIANIGVRTATAVEYVLYLSADETLDAADVQLATGVAFVPGNASSWRLVDFVVPAWPAGRYELLLAVDPADVYPEQDETNNLTVRPGGFATAYELTPTSLFAQVAGNGVDVTFAVEVRNDGAPFIGAIDVQISVAASPTAARLLVGTFTATVSGLQDTLVIGAMLPMVPPGRYLAFATVDAANTVDEIDELNNTIVSRETFGTSVDLTIRPFTIPATLPAGGSFRVDLAFTSIGATYDGPATFELFLSTDAVLDAADVSVHAGMLDFQNAATVSEDVLVTPPAALPPGNYFLIAVVGAAVPDVNPSNDAVASGGPISTLANFAILNVQVPRNAAAGAAVTVEALFGSDGAPYSGALSWTMFLSRDTTLDPSDAAVVSGTTNVAGQQRTLRGTFTLPATATGTYHVIVSLDPMNAIAERDERDNQLTSTPIQIAEPDLVAHGVETPPSAIPGASLTVRGRFANEGAVASGTFRYAIYLDDPGTPAARVLHRSTPLSLQAGLVRGVEHEVVMPLGTPAGQHLVWLVVDVDSTVSESSEANNLAQTTIDVGGPAPDLTGSIVDAEVEIALGTNFDVAVSVENVGGADAVGVELTFHLGSNPVVSIADLQIALRTSNIGAGLATVRVETLTMPGDVLPGEYFLGAILDPRRQIAEIDEGNNVLEGVRIAVVQRTLEITTAALPAAMVGAPYGAQIEATGGPGQRFTIINGDLPDGIALDANDGSLRGSPTRAGVYRFTVEVRLGPDSDLATFDLIVQSATDPLRIIEAPLPTGYVGVPYRVTLQADGGSPPYAWLAGSPGPSPFRIEPGGEIRGVPTTAGTYSIFVKLQDSTGLEVGADFVIEVLDDVPLLAITQAALPEGVVGVDYCAGGPVVLQAAGGAPPYSWSIVRGRVPGLSLQADGELCGEPTTAGRHTIEVVVTDTMGTAANASLTVVVTVQGGLRISDDTLPDAIVGQSYSTTLTAEGGDEPYVWSVADGALPEGLELDGAKITGVAKTAGLVAFTIRVTDATGARIDAALSIQVRVVAGSLERVEPTCGCTTTRRSDGAPGRVAWLAVLLAGLAVRRRRDFHSHPQQSTGKTQLIH